MQNNQIQLQNYTQNGVAYKGFVTAAAYIGDRLIYKETSHNDGMPNLFAYITSCLQGNWAEARHRRPCSLVLLKKDPNEALTSSSPATTNYWTSDYAVCSPIIYDTAAIANLTSTSGEVTYHFRVPYLSLVSGATISKLMLLPATASNYKDDACAYYKLTNPINVPDSGGNFTIIIDWTLHFENTVAPAAAATSTTTPTTSN